MIVVENLHKSFDNAEVLKGVSFRVERGETLALIGRSGYGKSVLLKHIAGLIQPDDGRVLVDDKDIFHIREKELLALRNRMGFLFQSGALFDSMTIFENIAFPLNEKTNLNKKEIKEKVFYELEQVGLLGSEDKYPSQVSGGMVKRASLARALIEKPGIMLFDEPTTGLDPLTGHSILRLINSRRQMVNFTGIIITHQIPQVFDIVDKIAMLHKGVIIAMGTPDEIKASEDPTVSQFISCETGEPFKEFEKESDIVRRVRRMKEVHIK